MNQRLVNQLSLAMAGVLAILVWAYVTPPQTMILKLMAAVGIGAAVIGGTLHSRLDRKDDGPDLRGLKALSTSVLVMAAILFIESENSDTAAPSERDRMQVAALQAETVRGAGEAQAMAAVALEFLRHELRSEYARLTKDQRAEYIGRLSQEPDRNARFAAVLLRHETDAELQNALLGVISLSGRTVDATLPLSEEDLRAIDALFPEDPILHNTLPEE